MDLQGFNVAIIPHEGKLLLSMMKTDYPSSGKLWAKTILITSMDETQPADDVDFTAWVTRTLLAVVREVRYNDQAITKSVISGRTERAEEEKKKDQPE